MNIKVLYLPKQIFGYAPAALHVQLFAVAGMDGRIMRCGIISSSCQ